VVTLAVDPEDPQPDRIAQAVDVLRRGGIVMYPTDTLYGLAVDPSRDDAVERLYEAKGRDPKMAVPLIAADLAQGERDGLFGAADLRLARAFWPGPLSLVVPARAHLSRRAVAGDGTIAVRVPAHPVARELARAFGACITATSANRSGQPPLSTVEAPAEATLPPVDVVLDAGPTAGGPPSTIVRIGADGVPQLVRAGAIAWNRVLKSLR
jgi:L-threonylcarbamoyladenylate synthase